MSGPARGATSPAKAARVEPKLTASERLDRAVRSRAPIFLAWIVSIVATAGSLNYSGTGAVMGIFHFPGMQLQPCELCWYQRIMMYPLTIVLAYAAFGGQRQTALAGGTMAIVGWLVATWHSYLQFFPPKVPLQCLVGNCEDKQFTVLGLSIANQSWLAFTIILILVWIVQPLWQRRYGAD
ncbi:MAG: disulfide bond formation protein B [Thermoplasmatota archaeon]